MELICQFVFVLDEFHGLFMVFYSIVQQQLQQQLVAEGQQGIQYAISADDGSSNVHQPLAVATEDADGQEGQITAEIVQADLPSPG